MSAIQFSGISSGLNTSGIIDSLMEVESVPQTTLKNRLSTEEAKLTALQSINSAIQALSTSAGSFLTGSTWKQLTATSSDTAITVAADSTATPANLSLSVVSRATSAKLSFADAHALTDVIADPGGTLTLALPDGTSTTVDTGDGTFKSILANLNALKDADGKALVNASSVNVGTGSFRLLISAGATGQGDLDLSGANLALGAASKTSGTSAEIDLGSGITVTSRSNTFTDLLPGVDVTLGAAATASTTSEIAIVSDPGSRSTAVKALVDQLNTVLSSISQVTSYGTISTTAGAASSGAGLLAGDGVTGSFAQQLLSTVYTATGGVLNDFGVSIDRYGKFQFDSTKFSAAYAKDPDAVQNAIVGTDGFAARLVKTTAQISGTAGLQADNSILTSDGQLTQMIKQQQKSLTRYNDQISAWDDRLAAKRASLNVLYTHLEVTLSKLTAQQSWLSSALEGLSSSSSSSK